jgi:hypothetical protein
MFPTLARELIRNPYLHAREFIEQYQLTNLEYLFADQAEFHRSSSFYRSAFNRISRANRQAEVNGRNFQ